MDNQPVIVTGPDRSGTSLMYALLASHPNISMVRRTNMFRWFYGKYGDVSVPDNFERCLSDMLDYKRMGHLNPDPDRIRREFWKGKQTYGGLFALFHQHNAERIGKPRWGDKSLHTEHYADFIFKEFPGARIIHMMRDPRDRYASVLKRYDDHMRGVASTTGRWMESARIARRNMKKHPDNYTVIRYETLAQHPKDTLQKVCDFIGESYDSIMLTMRGAPEHRDEGGNSSFGQIKPGVISTRSIGRYRNVLSRRQIAFIQVCAGRYLADHNYELDSVKFEGYDRILFYLADLPFNLIRLVAWIAMNRVSEIRGVTIPDHHLVGAAQSGQTQMIS